MYSVVLALTPSAIGRERIHIAQSSPYLRFLFIYLCIYLLVCNAVISRGSEDHLYLDSIVDFVGAKFWTSLYFLSEDNWASSGASGRRVCLSRTDLQRVAVSGFQPRLTSCLKTTGQAVEREDVVYTSRGLLSACGGQCCSTRLTFCLKTTGLAVEREDDVVYASHGLTHSVWRSVLFNPFDILSEDNWASSGARGRRRVCLARTDSQRVAVSAFQPRLTSCLKTTGLAVEREDVVYASLDILSEDNRASSGARGRCVCLSRHPV